MRVLSGPPSTPTIMADWTMPSSCVSLRMLLEEFPVLCARVVRIWNLVHYFVVLVLAVTDTGVWVLLSLESWIIREMSLSVGAMLDSTVDTCSSSVLWWLRTFFTHFLRCGGLES